MDYNKFVEMLGDLQLGDADETANELDLSRSKKKKKAAAAAAAPRNGYAEERRNDELVVALESDAVLSMHSLMRDETPTRMRALLFRELARTSVPLMDGRPEPPPAQP